MGVLNGCLECEAGIRLAVRIGIYAGLVMMVGEMGNDGKQEPLALGDTGDTPNVASRIQG
jgi:hypothetical protein